MQHGVVNIKDQVKLPHLSKARGHILVKGCRNSLQRERKGGGEIKPRQLHFVMSDPDFVTKLTVLMEM